MSNPKNGEIKTVSNGVEVPIVYFYPTKLAGWTDGSKWICDTMAVSFELPAGIGSISAPIDCIAEFIATYPHPVGTFFVIARLEEVAKLIISNPMRDIRKLVFE